MTVLRKYWKRCIDAVVGASWSARRSCRCVALCLVLLAVQMGFGPPVLAQSADQTVQASSFIDALGRDAISVMAAKSLGKAERLERYRVLLNRGFDLPTIGRFVLGRYWVVATPAQQHDYLPLFEEMVTRSYALMFDSYDGQTFRVLSNRKEANGDVIVASEVLQPKGPPVRVEWRVRTRDIGMRIIDVVIDGVSMSVTQRQEFASVIQAKGGNIDAFLRALRDKNIAMAND